LVASSSQEKAMSFAMMDSHNAVGMTNLLSFSGD